MTRSLDDSQRGQLRTRLLVLSLLSITLFVASIVFQWLTSSNESSAPQLRQVDGVNLLTVGNSDDTYSASKALFTNDRENKAAPQGDAFAHDKLESLSGLPMPYRLQADANGNLLISSDIRELFDFFLSAQIDAELDQLVVLIEQVLDAQLSGLARSQAQDILLTYLDMKRALYDYEQGLVAHPDFDSNSGLESMQARWQARERIRQEHLSPEVYETFYQREQALDTFTMARLSILKDQSLDEAARAQAVLDLVAASPENIKQAHEKSAKMAHLQAFEAAIDVSNADDKQALNALRREHFGEEALARFERLDQERAAWQRRLAQYKDEKLKISEQQGISESDKQAAIEQLKTQIFEPPERLRISAMEAAGRA